MFICMVNEQLNIDRINGILTLVSEIRKHTLRKHAF